MSTFFTCFLTFLLSGLLHIIHADYVDHVNTLIHVDGKSLSSVVGFSLKVVFPSLYSETCSAITVPHDFTVIFSAVTVFCLHFLSQLKCISSSIKVTASPSFYIAILHAIRFLSPLLIFILLSVQQKM